MNPPSAFAFDEKKKCIYMYIHSHVLSFKNLEVSEGEFMKIYRIYSSSVNSTKVQGDGRRAAPVRIIMIN